MLTLTIALAMCCDTGCCTTQNIAVSTPSSVVACCCGKECKCTDECTCCCKGKSESEGAQDA